MHKTASFNRTIYITHAQTLSTDKPLNEYTNPKKTVDTDKAQAELDAIADGYRAIGAQVLQFDTLEDSEGLQDVIYTANQAFCLNGRALIANLPYERQNEEALAEQWLKGLGLQTLRMPKELGLFSGKGDALYIPGTNYVLAGSGYRNNIAAHKFLEDTFHVKVLPIKTKPRRSLFGIQNDFIGKPYKTVERDGSTLYHSPAYDIDIALGIVKAQTDEHRALVAYAPSLLTLASQQFMREQTIFDTIVVSRREALGAFACNLLSNGQGVVINKKAYGLIAELNYQGLQVVTVTNNEIAKGGGGVHCVENVIDNNTPDNPNPFSYAA